MAQSAPQHTTAWVPLDQIRTDGGTQMRESINSNLVQQYAEVLGSGVEMDPAIVFYDGTDYWLADGFHRYRASEQIQTRQLWCDVRSGTRRDAILYACGANEKNQWARSRADKRRAVMTLLRDEEWGNQKAWSNRRVADTCRVSDDLVAALREELASETELPKPTVPFAGPESTPEMRTGSDGVTRSMPGTSRAPGAARKRVAQTVIEYDPIEPTTPDNDAVVPDDDEMEPPRSIDRSTEECATIQNEPVAQDPVTEEQHHSVAVERTPAWIAELDTLREQREQVPSYRDNRDTDRRLREGLGFRSEALELIDFVLKGGECALVRFGLSYSSSTDELKSAYRREGLRCHPDRGGNQQEMATLNSQFSLVKNYFESRL